MSWNLSLCAALVGLLAVPASGADGQEQRLADQCRDLSRIKIRGLQIFAEDEVREKLAKDPEALLAAHPLAPLEALPAVVSQRLLAGLRRAGFALADVRTEVDAEQARLVATVREGPRFLNGSVRIENAQQIDVDRLKRRLTERFPPREAVTPVFDQTVAGRVARWLDKDGKEAKWSDPVWTCDKPARLDAGSKAYYQRQVGHALEDLAFRDARFEVALEPNRQTRRVALVVRLRDEGRPAKLARIEIRGNQRDADEAIIDYLDLSLGMLMTRRRETQLRYDLWRSGRFTGTEVALQPAQDDDGHLLMLTVKDSPYAPPINQRLTEEEETLLKMGHWLANADAWPGDMVVRVQGERFEMVVILAARDGLLVSLRSPGSDAQQRITLVGSRREIACYSSRSDVFLRAAAPTLVLSSSVAYRLNDDPKEPDKPFSFSFGFGFKSRGEEDTAPPFRVAFRTSPAVCIAWVHAHHGQSAWEGRRLIVQSDKERFEIDRRDGRLIRYTTSAIELGFEEDAFAKALDALHESAAGGQNAFDPRRPLRSAFDFVLREEIRDQWAPLVRELTEKKLTSRQRDALGVWTKFISMGVLDPIDQHLTNRTPGGDPENKFQIPFAHPDRTISWIQGLALAMVPWSEDLFPRGSWPWTVWREMGFILAGRGQYVAPTLQHIYQSRDFGPVGILVVASLLERTSARAAPMIAGRGTWYMTIDDFRTDYLPLLDQTCLTGRCLRRACEILRALDEKEVQQLLSWVPDPWRESLGTFANELRRDTDRALDEAVPAALDIAWERDLRRLIEQRLLEIRDRHGFRVGNP